MERIAPYAEMGLTVKQAARRLGVHFATVRRLLRRGRLKPIVVGGRVRIDPQSIDAMIQADSEAWVARNVDARRRTPTQRRLAADRAAAELGIVIQPEKN